jgi:hypothetical protein
VKSGKDRLGSIFSAKAANTAMRIFIITYQDDKIMCKYIKDIPCTRIMATSMDGSNGLGCLRELRYHQENQTMPGR